MENGIIQNRDSYFAAANGFDGFRSYFPETFERRKYTRSFILKGGPGTGKSTLMKKLYSKFSERRGAYAEKIYCSSDPTSLDGVIIENEKGRISVLDATAPHVCESELPGAYDILIPLGEGLDNERLFAEREAIEAYNDKKQAAYKEAYDNLRISSIFDSKIKAEYEQNFDFEKGARLASALCASISDDGSSQIKRRLISSFSRFGQLRFNSLDTLAKTKYILSGDEYSSAIFLNILYQVLRSKKLSLTAFPRPLDGDMLDGILLNTSGLAFIFNDSVKADTDTSEFIFDYSRLRERTDSLALDKDRYLALAKEQFAKASENHFALEKIYTSAMNFDTVNAYYKKIENNVEKLLFS